MQAPKCGIPCNVFHKVAMPGTHRPVATCALGHVIVNNYFIAYHHQNNHIQGLIQFTHSLDSIRAPVSVFN